MKEKQKCSHAPGHYHYVQDYKWWDWWEKMNHDTLLGYKPPFYFYWWYKVQELYRGIVRFFHVRYFHYKYGK